MKRIFALLLLCVTLTVAASDHVPRYVFYFIGDGMGFGHMHTTTLFNRMTQTGPDDLLMTTFPVASVCTTWSASSPVTDSAAAGTALATGSKTLNGMLGMNADTIAVPSIATKLAADGWGIGLITTNSPDDATPGAFYAHVDNRGKYYEIGCQAAEADILYLGGAPMRGVRDRKGNPTDLLERFSANGVAVVDNLQDAASSASRRLLVQGTASGLENSLGYVLDSVACFDLPELTESCLAHLERFSPERFFMMVENGLIDWAGHGNDAASVVAEVNRLQEALRVAYNFYLAHPDETLIIVTADHETGGLIDGNNNPSLHYNSRPDRLAGQRMSKEKFSNQVKSMLRSRRAWTWDEVLQFINTSLGLGTTIPLTDDDLRDLREAYNDSFGRASEISDLETLYASFDAFTVKVFSKVDLNSGVAWTTNWHSAMPVPVFAIGAGAERFNSMMDNVDIPDRIMQVLKPENNN